MRVPAHIRFTLPELIAFGLQSAEVLARANSAIHLVLTEQQEGLPSSDAQDECSIISVEDADGITVAVLKHPEGKAWDRRVPSPIIVKSDAEGAAHVRRLFREADIASGIRGTPGRVVLVDEPEPVVPRREPPHAAPAGEGRFNLGVKAMLDVLKHYQAAGQMRSFGATYATGRPTLDLVSVDGDFSLRELASAFLAAYKPEITISDEVRFKLAVTAMKESLHRQFKDGGMERITWGECGPGGDDPKKWPDIIGVEGDIDMEALGRAFWSVMKEGQGR